MGNQQRSMDEWERRLPEGGQKGEANIRQGAIVPPTVSPTCQWTDEMSLAAKEFTDKTAAAGTRPVSGATASVQPAAAANSTAGSTHRRTFVIGVGMTKFTRPERRSSITARMQHRLR